MFLIVWKIIIDVTFMFLSFAKTQFALFQFYRKERLFRALLFFCIVRPVGFKKKPSSGGACSGGSLLRTDLGKVKGPGLSVFVFFLFLFSTLFGTVHAAMENGSFATDATTRAYSDDEGVLSLLFLLFLVVSFFFFFFVKD